MGEGGSKVWGRWVMWGMGDVIRGSKVWGRWVMWGMGDVIHE